MLDGVARRLVGPPLERAGRRLAAAGIGADQLTVAGFGLGVLAAIAIALDQTGLGLACLALNRLADGLDGAVARASGPTDLGGFLDITLDFITYSGVVFAFALRDPADAVAAAGLIFAFMGTGSSFLAFAAIAARRGLTTGARGAKSIYYLGGLAEGTETIAFLVLACLVPAWFEALAAVFGGLCWLTTLGRILTARRLLTQTSAGAAPPAPAG